MPEPLTQTPVQHLNFGPWSLLLRGDELVDIRHHTAPVLRGIRAVVRDHNWLTLSPTLSDIQVQSSDSSLRLTQELTWSGHSGLYTGTVCVLLEAHTLAVSFEGTAVEDFASNRIGLVVLHRPDDAGRPVTVTSPGGVRTDAAFPRRISPHQPFTDIAAMEWERDLVAYRVDFQGDVFETEDQRNWTDASFKTYGTPLSQPFPVMHRTGETVSQSIRLSARQIVRIKDQSTAAVPALGTAIGSLTYRELDLPDSLPPEAGPLLAEIALESDPVMGLVSVAEAVHCSNQLGLKLDARIVAASPEEAVAILHQLPLGRVESLGVFDVNTHVTEEIQWGAVKAEAARLGFQGKLLAGARSHFTELNRNPHSACPDADAVTYSITPQMHATEQQAIVETLEIQTLTAESAQGISNGRPLHIGPVTLAPRFNAVATEPPTHNETPTADGLQDTAFAAAWLVGSVAALTSPGVAAITYITLDDLNSPAGHLLTQLASYRGNEVLTVDANPRVVAAYPVRTSRGLVTHLANLTANAMLVRVISPSGTVEDRKLAPWQPGSTSLA